MALALCALLVASAVWQASAPPLVRLLPGLSRVQPVGQPAQAAAAGPQPIASGDLVVSSFNGQTVDEFTPTGTLVQHLMSGFRATGSAFDSAGNLYVTDFAGNQIWKRDAATGNVSVFSSSSTLGDGHVYNSPESIAFNSDFSLMYVSDANRGGPGGGINVVDPNTGQGVGFLPLPSSTGSEGQGESDWLAFTPAGSLLMTNENPNQGVMQVNLSSGDIVQPSFIPSFPNIGYALAFDKSGNLWVGDTDRILEYSPSGTLLATIPNSSFSILFSATFNPAGDTLFAGDEGNGNLFVYDLNGNLIRQFQPAPDVSGLSVAAAALGSPVVGPTPGNQQGGGTVDVPHGKPPCEGAPVNCVDGEFWHTFSDLSIPGRGPALNLTRTYSSLAAGTNGPLGFGWTDGYNSSLATDSSGRVTVTEESGATITFTPASGGGFTAPSRIVASLARNADGTFTLTRANQDHLTFSSSGQLVGETDRNGYATTLAYSGGQLGTVTDPAGRQLAFTFSGGRISQVKDPLGRTVSFQYDSSGNLQTATDVAGGQTKFTYDSNHLLLTMTDPNGGVLTNAYDSAGRVTSQADAMGRKRTFSYVPGFQTTITDPNGNVEVEKFQNNLMVSRTLGSGTPQAATWTYTYDPVSLGTTSITDPNQHASQATYDARGNMLSVTDALGRKTSYTYDSLNDRTSVTDPLGVTTTMAYDGVGNLLSSSRPLAGTSSVATTTLTYGDSAHPGDVTSVTDANGQVTSLTYDSQGDQVRTVDPLGNTTVTTVDAGGRMTSMVSPNGNLSGANPAAFRTTFTYNSFNQPLTATDPLGRKTSYTYDANRNRLTMTDGNGHTTSYTYDADNELIKTNRADGSTQQTAYDANGNVTSETDGNGNVMTYTYDPLDRRVSSTDALNRKTTYGYDGAGNMTSLVDPQSQTTTYAHDAANQLTGVGYSDGQTHGVAYTYDADGQRTGMSDGTGSSSYTYDSLRRLTQSVNGAGAAVGYGYDLVGRLTSITYPGGSQTVARGYDAAGRLTSVTDWLGNRTTFAYDADGNLVTQGYPNGTSASTSFTNADQVSAITDSGPAGQFLALSYTRDQVGQVTAEGSTSFSYDAVNRVTAGGSQTYGYDSADNVTSFTDSAGNQHVATYDAADELTQDTFSNDIGKTTRTLSYDARGNRVSLSASSSPNGGQTTTTYAYDQANRLTQRQAKVQTHGGLPATITFQYAYDGNGLRASKTVSGTSEAFTWDVAEGLPLLVQDGATSYVTGPGGLPLEQVTSSGAVSCYHQDQLGSTRAITDGGGNVAATYTYDAYGNVTGSSGSVSNPFQFAGQFLDAESGFYYLHARYFDPSTGQFISRDPAKSGQPYSYGSDNPANLKDPSGLFSSGDLNNALKSLSDIAGPASVILSGVGAICSVVTLLAPPLEAACGVIDVGALATGVVAAASDLVRLVNGDKEVHWYTVLLDLLAVIPGVGSLGLGKVVARLAEQAETLEKLGTFIAILVKFGEGEISIEALLIDFGKLAEDLKSVVTTGKWAIGGLDVTAAGLGWAAILSGGC